MSAAIAIDRSAVAMAAATDLVVAHGRALDDLAEVLELSGRHDQARRSLAQAIDLYLRKGVTALGDRARAPDRCFVRPTNSQVGR